MGQIQKKIHAHQPTHKKIPATTLYEKFGSFIHRTLNFRYLNQTRKVPIQTFVNRIFVTQHRSKAGVRVINIPLISRLGNLWLTQSTLKYFRYHHGGVGRREFLCKKAQASCIWRYRANWKRGSEASVKERTPCHSCGENTGETKYSVSHLLSLISTVGCRI